MNSDGKANLDILSPVKYGEELLNEQLIPWRYPAPAEKLENGTKYLFMLLVFGRILHSPFVGFS